MGVTKGILVATDAQIEWMLPWFVKKLRRVSQLPLVVVDLGISPQKQRLWSPFIDIIPFSSPDFTLPKTPQHLKELWDKAYAGNYEIGRKARLLKPFALDLTPFDQTLWLDLDCEVVGSLDSLFAYADLEPWVSMRGERIASLERGLQLSLLKEDEALYNSGVIVYKKEAPLLKMWREMTLKRGQEFIGDQELFARLLYEKQIDLPQLPACYNWRMADGPSEEAVIIHWVGDGGKRHILEEMLLEVAS